MSQNIFDSAAWYLLSYSNALSFKQWREAVKLAYQDLEAKYGIASAKDNLSKMVAYYCMEVAPGPTGRKALSNFRKVHQWADFRDGDAWWIEEWKKRRALDLQVDKMKQRLSEISSVGATDIHNDPVSRDALAVILAEAARRVEWDKRTPPENMATIEALARITISTFGGSAILDLYEGKLLRDRVRIPSLQTMYFVERVLVEQYGDKLIAAKQREVGNVQ